MYFIYIAWVVSRHLTLWVKIWANLPTRDVGVTDHGLEASEVSFRSSKLRRFRRFRWFRLGTFWCFSGWLNFSNFGMLELNKKSECQKNKEIRETHEGHSFSFGQPLGFLRGRLCLSPNIKGLHLQVKPTFSKRSQLLKLNDVFRIHMTLLENNEFSWCISVWVCHQGVLVIWN